jgi:hypothetical protein
VSTGLELIPLALAVAGVAGAVGRHSQRREQRAAAATRAAVLTLGTRLRDERLLVAGLARLGAQPEQQDGVWAGSLGGTGIALTTRPDGSYDAHFDAQTPPSHAHQLLAALDAAYCAELQAHLRGRVHLEAPQRGMAVVEEYQEEDGTVVLTLEFEQAS